ncbi:MAG: hypothetical protein AAFV90_28920 [Cyanobacteria bacterium J06634_5]
MSSNNPEFTIQVVASKDDIDWAIPLLLVEFDVVEAAHFTSSQPHRLGLYPAASRTP